MEDLSGFNPWLTRRLYSAHQNYCIIANFANKKGFMKLSPRAIYDFFYYTIPKNREFIKYPKAVRTPEDIRYVQRYYNCGERDAKSYMKFLEESEISSIINIMKEMEKQKKNGESND